MSDYATQKEFMKSSDSLAQLGAALAKAQSEMPAIAFDATNPAFKSKYATLGAMIEAARPILAKHGLSIVQLPMRGANEGEIGVETIILHESGEWMSNAIALPMGGEQTRNSAQLAGSIITYLRRYAYGGALSLYADEDNDGNTPQQQGNAPQGQQRQQYAPRPQQGYQGR